MTGYRIAPQSSRRTTLLSQFYVDITGLNMSKTKVMSNALVPLQPVIVESTALEIVDEYVYLEHAIQLGRSNFEKEVNRRIQLGWAASGKLRDIFSSKIP
ncbi:jg25280 [Pararge aegeria aegeria]|uniref:Jg25280 protein n=1 Tax=Pararge aegeria aegeria TaxID=348720 RepID=A0A8S4RF06_9NEOP|nr:jg25280 [Pararge aegeria aegeria]